MTLGIAIDIGAYECKAALVRSRDEEPTPILNPPIRSIAYIEKDGTINIKDAPGAASRTPRQVVHNIKRHLIQGDEVATVWLSKEQSIQISYLELYVALFREVFGQCLETLRERNDSFDHLVLTVPGFLEGNDVLISSIQRAVSEAVEKEGVNTRVELLVEPAGVGLYNLNQYRTESEEGHDRTVIVYDLGHSTLDVALLTLRKDEQKTPYELHTFRVVDDVYGGLFDDLIADSIIQYFRLNKEGLSASKRAKILRAASLVKCELSSKDACTVNVDLEMDDSDESTDFEMTKTQFEELIRGEIQESLPYINDLLRHAEEKSITVDEIILSGGGANIPLVMTLIQEYVGKEIPVRRSNHPIQAVSYGAAHYALTHDMSQYSKLGYGVQLPVLPGTVDQTVRILIAPNTKLPTASRENDAIRVKCGEDGVFRTTLYSYDKNDYKRLLSIDECKQIRHMPFEIACNQEVSVSLEMDTDHCVKVVCLTPENERYIMTNFDPANASSRKEAGS